MRSQPCRYQRKAPKLRDSLTSIESDKAMTEKFTMYETEKREALITHTSYAA